MHVSGQPRTSLVADLLAHRGDRDIGRKWVILWSVGWILLALGFGGWVALPFGRVAA